MGAALDGVLNYAFPNYFVPTFFSFDHCLEESQGDDGCGIVDGLHLRRAVQLPAACHCFIHFLCEVIG